MGNTETHLSQTVADTATTSVINNALTQNTNQVDTLIKLGNSYTLEVGPDGVLNCGTGGFDLTQTNNATATITTNISQSTANTLITALQNELTTSGSQTNSLVQGFLTNIGQNTNTSSSQDIYNTINSVIENNVTTENINNILNKLTLSNNGVIVINGQVSASQCEALQTNIANFVATQIFQTIINAAISNTVLTRAAAAATQSNTVQQNGLDSLVSSIFSGLSNLLTSSTIVIVVICIIILYYLSKSTGTVLSGVSSASSDVLGFVFSWRTLAMVLIVITIYLIVAYASQIPPFSPATEASYWTCQQLPNGLYNGVCVLEPAHFFANNPKLPNFDTQADCENAAAIGNACPQYWGCATDSTGIYTGVAYQCTGLYDGANSCPYVSETAANAVCSNFTTVCLTSSTGASGAIGYQCVRVNPDNNPYANMNYPTFTATSASGAIADCLAGCGTPNSATVLPSLAHRNLLASFINNNYR